MKFWRMFPSVIMVALVTTLTLSGCGKDDEVGNQQITGAMCDSSNPCPSGYRCDGGFCVWNGSPDSGNPIMCGNNPPCSSGLICLSGQCVTPSGSCSQLCATPSQTTTLLCWSQTTVGVIDHTMNLNSGQQGCCPVSSGAFTAPDGVSGSYTGRSQLCQSRSFERLHTGAYGGQR